jgi:hypothetical protein
MRVTKELAMFLTDAEQRKLLDEQPGLITGKIRRELAIALRQVDERQKQIDDLKRQVAEHDSFIVRFRRNLGSVIKS